MSGAAIGWAKRQQAPSPISKAILAALADYAGPGLEDRDAPAEADGRHFAFVGVERLSRETQYNVKTISRHLARLVDVGLVVRVRRMNGFIRTSSYTVLACDGNGDRPFTDEERLVAAALSGDQDSQSFTGVTCEEDSQGSSGKSLSATHRKVAASPPVKDSQGASEEVPGVPCVPYTGTTSNYEPPADPPAGGGRELALFDQESPTRAAVLTSMSGDGVWSPRTTPEVDNYRRLLSEITEEIMANYSAWVLKSTGQRLTDGDLREIRVEVKSIMGEDPTNQGRREALGRALREWTRKGMRSVKALRGFVRAAMTEALQVEDPQPNAAQRRHEQSRQIVRNAAAALGGRVIGKSDVEALLQRASGLGVAVTEQAAIGGVR